MKNQKEDKQDGPLQNRLQTIRLRLGLSQQELAQAASVARQTIGGIEAGLYAPSATVALRLAKTLGCRVEDLFWLEDDFPTVPVTPAQPLDGEQGIQSGQAEREVSARSSAKGNAPANAHAEQVESGASGAGGEQDMGRRVMLAHVGGRWIAHPLGGGQAFRSELVPADGLASTSGEGNTVARLLDEPATLMRTVLLAGCAPALSLWARSAERWHPGLRVAWLHANSTVALERLARGEVHAAGVHLSSPAGGQDNAPYVRAIMGNRAVSLVNLGVWEEGLVVQPGNPRRLRSGADLAQAGVAIVNRESGAGSRLLLDELLQSEGVDSRAVEGYQRIVNSHQEVARAVRAGMADAGMSACSVAAAYGLGFVPLRQVRYDLAFLRETLDYAPVQQLVGTLRHRWILSQLRTLGGYDTTHAGEVMEV